MAKTAGKRRAPVILKIPLPKRPRAKRGFPKVKIMPTYAERHDVVLKALGRCKDGATDDELSACLPGWTTANVRMRRRELVQHGLCEASELTRPSTTGRHVTVWILTELGRKRFNRFRPAPGESKNGR